MCKLVKIPLKLLKAWRAELLGGDGVVVGVCVCVWGRGG